MLMMMRSSHRAIAVLLLIALLCIENCNSSSSTSRSAEDHVGTSTTAASSSSSSSATSSSAHLRGLTSSAFFPFLKYGPNEYANLPKLFLLGAQKAGTESMFEELIKHPKICGSNGKGSGNWKESHFYSNKHFEKDGKLQSPSMFTLYQQGYDDPKCLAGKGLFADGTPCLHSCNSLQFIYNFYPESVRKSLRFIAILREPVSRDWSGFSFGLTHYHHFYGQKGKEIPILPTEQKHAWEVKKNSKHKEFFEEETCGEASDPKKFKDIFRGKYALQFEEYGKYFSREQLLVFNVESIFADPDASMTIIQKFLDLDVGWPKNITFPHGAHPANFDGEVPELACKDRNAIGAFYEPLNQRLYAWLNGTSAGNKPKVEPPFLPFKSYKNMTCVDRR